MSKNDSTNNEEKMSSITSKDWLTLSWNYFQQHAQQRISYFNFFVVFSTILTAALVSSLQANFQAPFLGIAIGMVESFVAYIFLKIDARNQFLTRNAEIILKEIETDFNTTGKKSYDLFISEEIKTQEWKAGNKSVFFLHRNLTHGDSYKIIYKTFFFIGLSMSLISLVVGFKIPITKNEPFKTNQYNLKINELKIDKAPKVIENDSLKR